MGLVVLSAEEPKFQLLLENPPSIDVDVWLEVKLLQQSPQLHLDYIVQENYDLGCVSGVKDLLKLLLLGEVPYLGSVVTNIMRLRFLISIIRLVPIERHLLAVDYAFQNEPYESCVPVGLLRKLSLIFHIICLQRLLRLGC